MNKLWYLPLVMATSMLVACDNPQVSAQPLELEPGTSCSLDGMLLLDYPGPKAQIHYANGEVEYFCDTVEMFAMLKQPEGHRKVSAAYTQDMGQAEWRSPEGHWIDARSAVYVGSSQLMGSMGPTFASFAQRADAEAFVKEHGGEIYNYEQVTPDMADLRGGAHHDERM